MAFKSLSSYFFFTCAPLPFTLDFTHLHNHRHPPSPKAMASRHPRSSLMPIIEQAKHIEMCTKPQPIAAKSDSFIVYRQSTLLIASSPHPKYNLIGPSCRFSFNSSTSVVQASDDSKTLVSWLSRRRGLNLGDGITCNNQEVAYQWTSIFWQLCWLGVKRKH
ncbi:hypothetical protein PanWU01x14_006100 [Parasponia andersonii]|uniref:Uncharacterized protein n=1 Tax=Parasponia andersonii TaxID=3476 RepID=A0A2P5E3S3_PARAD|nr:hypothetical protein PanWU01x14_006100 [Parasponia andersonii]